MKLILLRIKMAVVFLLLFCSGTISAVDFSYGGMYYNVVSPESKTCKLVKSDDFRDTFGGYYPANVVVPETVYRGDEKYTVTGIGDGAFKYCKGVNSLTIPSTVTFIEGNPFESCGITTINCYTSVPPSASGNTFSGISPTVYVYESLKDDYSNAAGWSNLTIVDDIAVTRITSITMNPVYECASYSMMTIVPNILPNEANIKKLEWSSSDTDIAVAMEDGVIVGLKTGTATITAKAKDGSGVETQCTVTVTDDGEYYSYNEYISTPTVQRSTTGINGRYYNWLGFDVNNLGSDCIYITKCIAKDPNDGFSTVHSIDDISKLGWVYAGKQLNLRDIQTASNCYPLSYEVHYQYKGQDFVYCSDVNDPNFKSYPSKPKYYDIVFKGWDSSELSRTVVRNGNAVSVPTPPVREGYTFDKWIPEVSAIAIENAEYVASYKVNQYKLTYLVDGKEYKEVTMDYGTAIKALAAPQKEGYTFSGWSEVPSTMPSNDVTITGSFAINSYSVKFVADGNTVSEQSLEYGSEIIAPSAPAKEGYTFTSWEGLVENVPARDVVVTAKYSVNTYVITYMYDNEIVNTVSVEYGSDIPEYEYSPEDTDRYSYSFAGWNLDGERFTDKTMMAKDITLVADIVVADGVRSITGDGLYSIYTINGVLVKKNATSADLKNLSKGLYIVNDKKYIVK